MYNLAAQVLFEMYNILYSDYAVIKKKKGVLSSL